jgi:predicted DNA-binding antitoxin AbrB/MazE fold protein
MQAYEAYYSNGRFVPLGIGKLPEGTRAIVTVLNEVPRDIEARLKEFDALVEEIRAAADEEMPPIEPIRFREVEV